MNLDYNFISCPICESKNTGQSKYINIDKYICYYCYTFFNKKPTLPQKTKNHNSNILELFKIYKNKNILIVNGFDAKDDTLELNKEYSQINLYSQTFNTHLNQCLKYGKLDILILPDANITNITEVILKCKKIINNKFKIFIGFNIIEHNQNTITNNEIIQNSIFLNNIFAINLILSKNNIGIQSIRYFDNYCLIEAQHEEPDNENELNKNQNKFDEYFKALIRKAI